MQAKRKASEDQSADGVATDLEHGDAVEVMTSHPMQAYKFCSSRSNSKLFLAKSYNCVLANAGSECWIF